MIALCWQDWRHIREETAVVMLNAAMMLDWGNSTLDITTAGIVGVSYCCLILCIALRWCWQCLLTVGGNLLPHTVKPLDVTTWHNAVDRRTMFYTLQNARQQHCKHHSYSGQQVSSLPDIAREEITVCLLQISTIKIIWHCGLAVRHVYLASVSVDSLHYLTQVKDLVSPCCCISQGFLTNVVSLPP